MAGLLTHSGAQTGVELMATDFLTTGSSKWGEELKVFAPTHLKNVQRSYWSVLLRKKDELVWELIFSERYGAYRKNIQLCRFVVYRRRPTQKPIRQGVTLGRSR
ncbi:MAG: hypothetical protein ACLFVS_06630 [Candidatus Acetothermia bacterium]